MHSPMAEADRLTAREVIENGDFRLKLARFVQNKVPLTEVDDVVQATLTDALGAAAPPSGAEAVQRWVYGIARHKIADHFRIVKRGQFPDEAPEAQPAPDSGQQHARDMLRWAERELPREANAERTFEWMLREGNGEHLEEIAQTEAEPAPRVRQRVSRLRRYFRERWVAQTTTALVLALLALGGSYLFRELTPDPEPPKAEHPAPLPEYERLRHRAFRECEAEAWSECLRLLDMAMSLDPAGDRRSDVQRRRREAAQALARETTHRERLDTPPPLSPTSEPAPEPSSPPRRTGEPTRNFPPKIERPKFVPTPDSDSMGAK